MKHVIFFVLTSIVFVGCGDDDNGPTSAEPGVYVVGYEDVSEDYSSQARLWKDGEATVLTDASVLSKAKSVFISGPDVYAVGYTGPSNAPSIPVMWKNGVQEPVKLSKDIVGGSVNKVLIVGKDVYMIGFQVTSKFVNHATLWKNGEVVIFTESKDIYFESLAVSGSDVYIGGFEELGNISVATIWKNGTPSRLGSVDGSVSSGVNSICVVGGDVYAVGTQYNIDSGTYKAVVWKNGVADIITTSQQQIEMSDIEVSGADVYAAGFMYQDRIGMGIIWKNGNATPVVSDSNYSNISDIFVINDDVYAAGMIQASYTSGGSGRNYRKAVLWKNGVMEELSKSHYDAQALSVFVVR